MLYIYYQQQKAYAEQTFGEAETMIGLAEANQETAQSDYNSASQGITDINNMINGANVAQLVNLPYTDELIKYGKTNSLKRSFRDYGAFTLPENETKIDTNNNYIVPNGCLCCYMSFFSVNTSSQFYTTHFSWCLGVSLGVGQRKHTISQWSVNPPKFLWT